jgi:hypothetical protein
MDLSELRALDDWCKGDLQGLLARVREGVYGAPGSPRVYFEDADTYKDITDLYSILKQNLDTGSPNLENSQVEGLAASIQDGYPLSAVEIGVLQRLLAKYAKDLAELRASPDRQGQDYTSVPDAGTARLVGSHA